MSVIHYYEKFISKRYYYVQFVFIIDKSVLKNVIVSDQIGEISMNFRHSSNVSLELLQLTQTYEVRDNL